jgi:hypothetical protein
MCYSFENKYYRKTLISVTGRVRQLRIDSSRREECQTRACLVSLFRIES